MTVNLVKSEQDTRTTKVEGVTVFNTEIINRKKATNVFLENHWEFRDMIVSNILYLKNLQNSNLVISGDLKRSLFKR